MKKFKLKFIIAVAFLAPLFVFISAGLAKADSEGQVRSFFVNNQYDRLGRNQIYAVLVKSGEHAYFYADTEYWNNLSQSEKENEISNVSSLASEFDNNIYPKETAFWGSEPNPGIDNDPKITVLMEDLVRGNGGYFESSNEYQTSSTPNSNQREMVAVNVQSLTTDLEKTFLAHEFQHLISFNQKENLHDVSEDTWLNELRSEYSPALLGYDSDANSNFQSRVRTFLSTSPESLTDWLNNSENYAQVSLFGRYLSDQYGPGILKETLQSPYVGIDSINKYLEMHGYKERFADVFADWLAADFVNDSSSNPLFGYKNPLLKNFKIQPGETTYLSGDNYLFQYDLQSWQPFWHEIIISPDASKALKISFNAPSLEVMYLDNLNRAALLPSESFIKNDGNLKYIVLMPVNTGSLETNFNVNLETVNAEGLADTLQNITALKDGALIKKNGENDIYVLMGKYKRYLSPQVLTMYGLDASMAIGIDEKSFDSYTTSNYVRFVNDKKVYAVWPDGTKHWLNMTGKYFSDSGRDWNSIFIINQPELNFYKTGTAIKK